jgi:hypothetical protein
MRQKQGALQFPGQAWVINIAHAVFSLAIHFNGKIPDWQ